MSKFDTEELRAKVPVEEYIGNYVALKKTGKVLKGLCPIHAEKTPSFTVSPARKSWHCFGCGKGGDVIGFAQFIHNCDFVEACRMLGANERPEAPPQPLTAENHSWLGAAVDTASTWRKIVNLQDEKNRCRDEGTSDSRERWADLNRKQRVALTALYPMIERLDAVVDHEPRWSGMPMVKLVITPDIEPFILGTPAFRQFVLSLVEGQ